MSETRKRIVTATSTPANNGGYPITAFCDDGTIWQQGYVNGYPSWKRLPSIPAVPPTEEV